MHPQPHQHQHYQQPHQHQHQQWGHAQADPNHITCPKCHEPKDSVKSYTMMSFLIFILVGAWWRTKRVVACDSCMRGELILSSCINLVTANLLSPFVLLWHGVLFAMTFQKGHSQEVLGYLR